MKKPLSAPFFWIAWIAYSEQLGVNLQTEGRRRDNVA